MSKSAIQPNVILALSHSGGIKLVQRALDKKISASNSGSWGPFDAGYSVNLQIAGGDVQFVDLDAQVSLSDVQVQGTVLFSLAFDLGNILPHLCFPPTQICVDIPLVGNVCTPQVCVSWPKISVPTIPIIIPPLDLSVVFSLSTNENNGAWNVDLDVYPFSLQIDLTPSINAIIDQVESTVNQVLGGIPLIGGLLEQLIDTVLNTLKALIDTILADISNFIRSIILSLDVFSPTIPFNLVQIPAVQKILTAGTDPGDREVDLTITTLTPTVTNQELVVTATAV